MEEIYSPKRSKTFVVFVLILTNILGAILILTAPECRQVEDQEKGKQSLTSTRR